MGNLSDLDHHPLAELVLVEGQQLLPTIDVKPGQVEWPDDVLLDERQYYVQRTGFFLAHMLTWCKQLDLAIEFLANFDYSKKVNATRADHTIYNLENYLIRVNSVYDRGLQLINAVFISAYLKNPFLIRS